MLYTSRDCNTCTGIWHIPIPVRYKYCTSTGTFLVCNQYWVQVLYGTSKYRHWLPSTIRSSGTFCTVLGLGCTLCLRTYSTHYGTRTVLVLYLYCTSTGVRCTFASTYVQVLHFYICNILNSRYSVRMLRYRYIPYRIAIPVYTVLVYINGNCCDKITVYLPIVFPDFQYEYYTSYCMPVVLYYSVYPEPTVLYTGTGRICPCIERLADWEGHTVRRSLGWYK